MVKKHKVILPPDLPPEVSDDEIDVSDEDLDFVRKNKDYAGFVSALDTKSITRHVSRVADMKEDELEALYEKRRMKKSMADNNNEKSGVQVDPSNALPIKNFDGTLQYITVDRTVKQEEAETVDSEKNGDAIEGMVRLTKADKRAKLKKAKKDTKKKGKEHDEREIQDSQATAQADVLAEVKEDLTAEELTESKKRRLAELGMALLSDPESNIKSLKEMLQLSKDSDSDIVKLGLLSLLAVFRDIIPGYRIRLPTDKELEMKVSKVVKKTRFYESTLLSSFKAYLQRLIALEHDIPFQHVVIRCLCSLLEAVPHFNFRGILIKAVVENIGSADDVVRKLCCAAIKSLFTNEGKHNGEATVEAVQHIANHVKINDCVLHPDSIEVLLSLTFDEDLRKPKISKEDSKPKIKRNRRIRHSQEQNQLPENDRKRSKKEMMTKMKQEVDADYKAASFSIDVEERKRMQSDTLSAVFQTYFRILKHTMLSLKSRTEDHVDLNAGVSGVHPLLGPCLDGLGKFSHMIDLDFMKDLMKYLNILAASGSNSSISMEQKHTNGLTVSERLRCCIVAFKVMRSNLYALNVDLHDFSVQLYNLILEYRPGRDQGEVLAEALKIMLCEDRQHDMQKAAAFIKRLATFSLCFGCPESMAALVTLKHLLQKNVKCRNLLENDAGGGSVSGSIAKYQPFASDPNLSGALASVLWELDLLSKHYHPTISTIASSITTMNTNPGQVYLSAATSPQQAFIDLSLEHQSFLPTNDGKPSSQKRKRATGYIDHSSILLSTHDMDEDKVCKKLRAHFTLVRDIKENEAMRRELNRTTKSLQLYEAYKKQRKKKLRSRTSKLVS
uniref:Nucleolar complex protein 3 homolog n=1 Tax=Kalanchoe fedtschenkoi TaxID=63787 RepID=A0A7N0UTD6_KALFE